jgi:hypothetical protein
MNVFTPQSYFILHSGPRSYYFWLYAMRMFWAISSSSLLIKLPPTWMVDYIFTSHEEPKAGTTDDSGERYDVERPRLHCRPAPHDEAEASTHKCSHDEALLSRSPQLHRLVLEYTPLPLTSRLGGRSVELVLLVQELLIGIVLLS